MTVLTQNKKWSKSQAAVFKECGRKYALSYGDNSLTDKALELKSIKNRHLWFGQVLHEAVGDLLKLLRQEEPLDNEEAVVQKIQTRLRDEFRASKETPSAGPRLFEHIFNSQVSNEVWKSHWNKLEAALRWFLKSPWLNRLKEIKPENWKAIDEVLSFDIDGIKTFVKIDCGLEVGGRFVLIDWKSGKAGGLDAANMQIAALYAHEVWGADPELIDAFVVSFDSKTQEKIIVDEDSLMEAFLRIQEESAVMEEKNYLSVEDPMKISQAPDIKTCFQCNFQTLCHPNGVGL